MLWSQSLMSNTASALIFPKGKENVRKQSLPIGEMHVELIEAYCRGIPPIQGTILETIESWALLVITQYC